MPFQSLREDHFKEVLSEYHISDVDKAKMMGVFKNFDQNFANPVQCRVNFPSYCYIATVIADLLGIRHDIDMNMPPRKMQLQHDMCSPTFDKIF